MNEEASAGSTQFAAHLGQMEPFDVSKNDWASYEERLTSFLIVNRVPEGDRVHAFLSIIGPSTYSLLKSLVAPELPSAKSFEVLKKTLGDHLSPKPSVIGERAKFHRRQQVEGELEPTEVKLRTYTGALVIPKGVLQVKVQHGGHTASLPLYVVDQEGPPLLGREWLQAIRLEWSKIWDVHHLPRSEPPISRRLEERLHALITKYGSLFKDELGMITEERAELYFKPNQAPKFLKARNVPFALQKSVEAELSKMEKMGIIAPVATSDYATPVVPVIKKDVFKD
ncbi:uncharacterized protein K02A2.6-like [Dermacentor silvarum]|uniref:uncharacterized protein K02A2.6-like n=1 Tax=Dermacentor silvarum TaxID=543639 RepID=UPI0021017ED8|nr:uncharacterized protein K02A2.6-like [Dermacentor silvarum]